MIANRPILSVGFTRKVQKLLEAAGGGVSANCFDAQGKYVDVDLMAAFQKTQGEAEKMMTSFPLYVGQNRWALTEIKQKVRRLID